MIEQSEIETSEKAQEKKTDSSLFSLPKVTLAPHKHIVTIEFKGVELFALVFLLGVLYANAIYTLMKGGK